MRVKYHKTSHTEKFVIILYYFSTIVNEIPHNVPAIANRMSDDVFAIAMKWLSKK
jgi:hypothetical protein